MTSQISVGLGGSWRPVGSLSVGASGVWRTVQTAWVGVGGVWRQAYSAIPSLTATASPSSQAWNYDSPDYNGDGYPDTYIFYATVNVSASGGVPPYGYSWTVTGYNGGGSYSTGYGGLNLVGGDGSPAQVTCTVTDSVGASVTTNTCTIG